MPAAWPGRQGGCVDGLTQTGLAIGTPAYMSPEQAAGDREWQQLRVPERGSIQPYRRGALA